MLSNDLHWDARVTTEWASDGQVARFDDFYNFAPDRKRTLVDACRACAFAGLCTGVYEEYAARWDVSALRPIAPT
jgi:hypothetical protein